MVDNFQIAAQWETLLYDKGYHKVQSGENYIDFLPFKNEILFVPKTSDENAGPKSLKFSIYVMDV